MNKKNIAILYVEADKYTLYTDAISKPVKLVFADEIVSNLEIIDRDRFTQVIEDFIHKNEIIKIVGLAIVLDRSVTFEKDVDDVSLVEQQVEATNYLELVPFDEVLSKVYRIKNKVKVIAVNNDLYQELISILKLNEVNVKGVVPFSVFTMINPEFGNEFNQKLIVNKFSNYKQYSLLDTSDNQEKAITYVLPDFKSPQFLVLIGTFLVLLLILLVLIYTQIIAPNNNKLTPVITVRTKVLPTKTSLISPTPTAKNQ